MTSSTNVELLKAVQLAQQDLIIATEQEDYWRKEVQRCRSVLGFLNAMYDRQYQETENFTQKAGYHEV